MLRRTFVTVLGGAALASCTRGATPPDAFVADGGIDGAFDAPADVPLDAPIVPMPLLEDPEPLVLLSRPRGARGQHDNVYSSHVEVSDVQTTRWVGATGQQLELTVTPDSQDVRLVDAHRGTQTASGSEFQMGGWLHDRVHLDFGPQVLLDLLGALA